MPEQPSPRTGPERRRAKRIPIQGVTVEVMKVGMTQRVPMTAANPNPNLALSLLDLSSGGLRILSWADLNVKERVIVKLAIAALTGRKFNCRGMVKWKKQVQMQEKPAYEMGIEYIDMPQEDRILLRELEK